MDSFNEKEREVSINTNLNKNYYPDEKSGICVVRRKDETVEDLLKRFRKKFSKSGVSKEIRDRMYFEKPSIKKRKKKLQSIRLSEKEQKARDQQDDLLEKTKSKYQQENTQRRKER